MRRARPLRLILLSFLIISAAGCGRIGNVYLSASMTDTYLAAANASALTAKEAYLIVMDYQNRYNHYYAQTGISDFWNTEVAGTTFSEYLKEKRLREEVCALLLLDDMAKENDLSLDESEIITCQEAAAAYYSGLNDAERAFCQAKETDVQSLYEKYRLAQKMIASMTDGVYLEISDNDKRVITVQIISVSDASQAETLKQSLQSGADFQTAAKEYSSLSKIEYQVSRGMLSPALEDVAFYLADGEMSDVIESEGYYFLIKCIDDFDEALSEANEDQVYRSSLYGQWGPQLEAFAEQSEVSFREKLWDQLSFYETDAMPDYNLYEIYDQYFPVKQR